MNSLHEDLFRKAMMYVHEHTDDQTSDREQDFMLMEKFAELVVRECIGCCEQVISDPVPKSVDTWLNGGSQCIDQIKEHFGVE